MNCTTCEDDGYLYHENVLANGDVEYIPEPCPDCQTETCSCDKEQDDRECPATGQICDCCEFCARVCYDQVNGNLDLPENFFLLPADDDPAAEF